MTRNEELITPPFPPHQGGGASLQGGLLAERGVHRLPPPSRGLGGRDKTRAPWILALLTLLVLALPAWAHGGKAGFSEVMVEGKEVTYLLEVPGYYLLTDLDPMGPPPEPEELHARISDIAKRVQATIHVANGEEAPATAVQVLDDEKPNGLTSIVMHYRFQHPVQDLRIRYELFDPQEANFQNLLKVHYLDETYEMALTPKRNAFRQLAGGYWATIASFVQLGIEHIFTGYDHIAFIIGLLILGGSFRGLLKVISAFTVAHSITLIAAATGAVTMPSKIVECAIALSIAYIAVENFFLKKAQYRWVLAFAFGLIHGFGFSSALAELGLPTKGLVESLLSFNVGVEVGQIVIVSLLFPLVLWSARRSQHVWVVRGVSGVILALGLMWFVQRLTGA